MAYRIDPGKPFDIEVRTAAAEQLEKAMSALLDSPEGLHEGIHTARKHIKRVRALYRLVARRAPEFQRRENRRLRDMAHSLSTFRDGTALIEVSLYLRQTAASRSEAAALARVTETLTARRDWLARAETDLAAKTEAAIETCRNARAALDDVSFEDGHRAAGRLLRRRWKKTCHDAAAALAKCQTEAHSDQFHELRKRSQDYWMHHALLRDIWPSAMNAKQSDAKALVDILGRYNDLTMLAGVVDHERELFSRSDDLARLLEAIISRQQTARGQALEKARQVFSDPPGQEARTIERLWLAACG